MAGSAPSNSQAVDFEKQQAAEADLKETQRQQRLTQGQQLIDQIFNGSPVMGPKSYDWSSFKAPQPMTPIMSQWLAQNPGSPAPAPDTGNVPAGYTAVQVAPRGGGGGGSATGASGGWSSLDPTLGKGASSYGDWSQLDPGAGKAGAGYGDWSQLDPTLGKGASAAGGGGGGQVWALKDANGKIYYQGDPLTYQAPTGKTTGGFDDAFFNAYKQKVLDYYQPDEARQYAEAKRDLTFNLAQSGNLYSSTAADKTGELAYQDALQKGNIVANANAQEGNLKNQIQSNKESLINQLYATEDPTLTANLAESSVNATRLQDPNLTPAAALFAPALSAVGSVVNAYTSPYGVVGQTGSTSPVPAPSTGTKSGQLSSGGPVYR
jgi:hypothetical protein